MLDTIQTTGSFEYLLLNIKKSSLNCIRGITSKRVTRDRTNLSARAAQLQRDVCDAVSDLTGPRIKP